MTTTGALSLAGLERFDPRAPGRHGQTERRYLCPLCGHQHRQDAAHRSLSVNTQTGAYHCHRCGADGKLTEHWTDRSAMSRQQRGLRDLRRATSLPPAQPHERPATPCTPPAASWRQHLHGLQPFGGTPGAAYLAGRGIPPAAATGVRYSPSWYGRPAVVFPLYNPAGKLVAAHGRHTDGREDPKSHTAGPAAAGVYATSPDGWTADLVAIAEAPIDALSLAVCGLPALALCGTALRPWLLLELAWRRVVLAFDDDAAGERAAAEWTAALAPCGARVLRPLPFGAKDWNEELQDVGAPDLREALALWLRQEAAR